MGHNKDILRGKFISMSAYIKRTERSQINDLRLHLKLLEKQEQAKAKTSRRREIIKIRAKINFLVNIDYKDLGGNSKMAARGRKEKPCLL
jgi:hypothetical protein